jgi:HK97 family phage prohead protease
VARTYRPPKGVQDEAQLALEWIKDGKAGSGFTDVGRKRASDLAAGRALSEETVLRMFSYLSRHAVDKEGQGFSPGEEGYPSPGRVAWAAWGGDPGYRWSSSISEQLNAADDRSVMEDNMIETRALPPSYRPSTSDDVPVFRPACANCEYLQIVIDVSLEQPVSRCTRWDAEVAAESYCDAWEPGAVPSWIKDDDAMEVEEDRSAELLEARRSIIETAEKRTFTSEVRASQSEDGSTQIVGYAAMWDQEADGLPFREVIKRGAFAASLDRGDDVFLLVNHDTDALPLARRSAGTLNLIEDEVGLRCEAVLDPLNPRAAELSSALSRGDVDKMSFAFRVAEDGTTKTKDGVRELRTLDLFEVSVVTWPAYSATSVGVRSASDDIAARWRFAQLRASR